MISLATIVLIVLLVFVVLTVLRSVRIVPQASTLIVERLGRYSRTLEAGLHVLIPFFDRVRARVDLREQVVSFPPQPVITSDNLVVGIDTVIYFQPTDPRAAVYEIANYIQGIEQLTVTTLRNVIGSLDLEQTLTSRDEINGRLRGVLDEATGRWGIRVNRVELKSIDPPASIQDSMEQQMRADRSRRAVILTAEGQKQSQILTAEGEKQSAVLRAEGAAQAAILRSQGEARAITQVFDAIHRGNPNPALLAYQYLQTLPQIAAGASNKLWVIPAELTEALRGIGSALGGDAPAPSWASNFEGSNGGAANGSGSYSGGEALASDELDDAFAATQLEDPATALRSARAEAEGARLDATATVESRVRRADLKPDASSPVGSPVSSPVGRPVSSAAVEEPVEETTGGASAAVPLDPPPGEQR